MEFSVNHHPLGIFNFAESYLDASDELKRAQLRSVHRDAPIHFLINHSVELYLKAYLHAKGISEYDLSRYPYGHRLLNLIWEAKKQGLCPTEQTYAVVRKLDHLGTQMDSRYLRYKIYRPIREEVLERAVQDLRQEVGKSLRRMGFSIRL